MIPINLIQGEGGAGMFIEGALLGGEGRGDETLEQLSVLLAPGETATNDMNRVVLR